MKTGALVPSLCLDRYTAPWLVGGVVLLVALPIRAYQAGPPPGVTGGFGEETCQTCHATYELNEGRKAALGDVMLSGLPERYEPGKTYRVTVRVDHTEGRSAWGFQLAVREKGGAQAGSLRPMNPNTQVLARDNVQYIEHTPDGSFFNTFEFDWVAPGSAVGDVLVHVAGNAANGDTDISGDYIYSTSVVVPVASH